MPVVCWYTGIQPPPHTTLRPKMQLMRVGQMVFFFITMRFKAKVYIRLRESVSDAAGNAIMANVNKVAKDIKVDRLRINKMIELNFEVENEEKAREQLDILSDRMFANIVIEDWEYDLDVVD